MKFMEYAVRVRPECRAFLVDHFNKSKVHPLVSACVC